MNQGGFHPRVLFLKYSAVYDLLYRDKDYVGEAKRALWAGPLYIVRRKLEAINAAVRLEDLKVPPANRLEKLKGNLKDFYSIRINDQWRVIFRWVDGDAHDVRIVDYH